MRCSTLVCGLVAGAALNAAAVGALPECSATSGTTRNALVELYTSQGCSSCPPADHWLSRWDAAPGTVKLSLHVKYWDYIGWKDPFAKPEFEQRQRALARLNSSASVYTPGVFLAGSEWRDWRDAAAQTRRVSAITQSPAKAAIQIKAGEVTAQIHAGPADAMRNTHLFVAYTRSHNKTRVTAGENRGESLLNDYVVYFWSNALAFSPSGIARFKLPPTQAGSRVAAFVQNQASGEVLQALQTAECSAS